MFSPLLASVLSILACPSGTISSPKAYVSVYLLAQGSQRSAWSSTDLFMVLWTQQILGLSVISLSLPLYKITKKIQDHQRKKDVPLLTMTLDIRSEFACPEVEVWEGKNQNNNKIPQRWNQFLDCPIHTVLSLSSFLLEPALKLGSPLFFFSFLSCLTSSPSPLSCWQRPSM